MNRGRRCLGKNSYQKELFFNPVSFLEERLINNESVSWLDLCCGEGQALIEAAAIFANVFIDKNPSSSFQIIGIDLAGMFQKYSAELRYLKLLETSLENFLPSQEFDLITCVHGLHYIGDKLSALQKTARWLKEDGLFLANLELKSLKLVGRQNSKKTFSDLLKKQKFIVDDRRHLITLKGKRNFDLPTEYSGADDQAGPNYTGQAAVDSYYKF